MHLFLVNGKNQYYILFLDAIQYILRYLSYMHALHVVIVTTIGQGDFLSNSENKMQFISLLKSHLLDARYYKVMEMLTYW